MRKGADCLSKWIGETERQLRLLFEEAQLRQPSIIFFDEIDGLAPVRSSRQDYIHSSIVSTLLALMDGLSNRGNVIVIGDAPVQKKIDSLGATNRIDAIDPALRRPGRFDREFLFPLPNGDARRDILKIHLKSSSIVLTDEEVEQLAEKCSGYAGADLKAMCTEAAMRSLRREYPQIYDSKDRLLLDPSTIKVSLLDFDSALTTMTPSTHRASIPYARPLPPALQSALSRHVDAAMATIGEIFPFAKAALVNDARSHPLPRCPLTQQ
jgi:ATPase family AAA domain-containing protein 2